jgi:hypothetical protein
MMVAGTAASVGIALANDRNRTSRTALTPALAEPVPQRATVTAFPVPVGPGSHASPRDVLTRRLGIATLLGVAVIALAASLPALTAMASNLRSSSTSERAAFGPPSELRSANGVSGDWERAYSTGAPSASQLGAVLIAGADEQNRWATLKALLQIAADREAANGEVRAIAAAPHSLTIGSGLAAGTVLRARITIYGCTGPGGGFCNHMASGGVAFAGAAACSNDLQFGTRFTIDGDPTGRTYECLDRGELPATWIDVYFDDTSDGIAWQSTLGATTTDIHIVN